MVETSPLLIRHQLERRSNIQWWCQRERLLYIVAHMLWWNTQENIKLSKQNALLTEHGETR